jgi:hypothetical protein
MGSLFVLSNETLNVWRGLHCSIEQFGRTLLIIAYQPPSSNSYR